MKKLVMCCLFGLIASPMFAQFYVRTNVGYSLPLASQQIGTEQEYSSDGLGDATEVYRGVYGSYGTGFSAHVGVGGSITKSGIFGYDVEFGYLWGKEISVNSMSTYPNYKSINEQSQFSRSFRVAPSLTFTTGSGKVQPFARLGPVIASTTVREERYSGNTYYNTYYRDKYKYTGGMSVGFKGSIGATFGISESIQLFAELNFISMNYSPKKRTLFVHEVNGEDHMEDIPEENRVVEFEREVDSEGEDEPEIRPVVTMSSIGLQFGAKFIF